MKNKKIITSIGSVSMSLIMLLNGCAASSTNDKPDFSYSDSDYNNFVTYENLNTNKWYVIEVLENDNYTLKLTRETSFDKINCYSKECYRYYYTDILKEDYVVYIVDYNREEQTFWVETGPEIISATPLTEFLKKYNLNKASYSKYEIENIFNKIKEEYYEQKKLGTSKVYYLSKNSMY